jgi:uroporphyrinogen decarboxylase
MGIDILNPVQCNTPNMEPERLKAEFGDRLVFWGGGTDTQTVLPFGTPDEVRQQVRERVSTLGAGGGYVFAPSQDIQADVPPENLVAMYDAAQEYGRYPVSHTE